ncbi:MAG: pyruvate:ferredoxin (flavodoxin) oxidoreductase [Myxococcota bacterium]
MAGTVLTVDGNEAVARVAHKTNEVIAIYPITPASRMGELCEEWSADGQENLWKEVPEVVEMQSEAGAAGAIHGALQAGALATTFTASQGLLLMIPDMYKIAGELTPFVLHVAARTIATHALSIFGDHSDVMACRQTGFALLASNSVQEAHDLACIAQAATLRSRIPFLHFFDGFRTSHEVNRIHALTDDDLRVMLDQRDIDEHRKRALDPDHPVARGTTHNPDTYFQAREACNAFYLACPDIVLDVMEAFAQRTGRRYGLFEYVGHREAERVIIMMGSGAETAHETVEYLASQGKRVGLLKVRLFRPFSTEHFLAALPRTTRAIAVLDRTKEPGSVGEPLFQDVVSALHLGGPRLQHARVVGGRYGLSSKEFTPAMVKSVLDMLAVDPPRHSFTVGITDDVTHTSIPVDPSFQLPTPDVRTALFYGLGSDGTVGSNKQTIKLIGDKTGQWAQAYFVYDSKKSGAMTVSHLRYGPRAHRAPYLIRRADYVGVHQPQFLEKAQVLESLADDGILLINAPWDARSTWDHLTRDAQQILTKRRAKVYVIDAEAVARRHGLPGKVSTVLQACFFALTRVLPLEDALDGIRKSIRGKFTRKGDDVVTRNLAAVDDALAHLQEVPVSVEPTATRPWWPTVPPEAPNFVQRVTAMMMEGLGDALPVSAFPVDGTWPTGTSRWERRRLAKQVPAWDPNVCIQCNKCVLFCPHAAIRAKAFPRKGGVVALPPSFQVADFKGREFTDSLYTLQVAPEDCTGCGVCAEVCPAHDRAQPEHKALEMEPLNGSLEKRALWWNTFQRIPDVERTDVKLDVRGSQLLRPLFEFSGACAGCGEAPYVKLLTQLFGDRLLMANATGCSSIYGGNQPTCPYTVDDQGRGPAWANSLFEDNAEFGLGMRLGVDVQERAARRLVEQMALAIGTDLAQGLLNAPQETDEDRALQRDRVEHLRSVLKRMRGVMARQLELLAHHLVKRSVWLVGGDGWAYDIGFGGLDHVISLGRKVNILVLDTESYSNTGGQQSKATPRGAAAVFASAGKSTPKKDLGLMAMTYGNIYVARVAMGAKDAQTLKAFVEAEAFPGPSLIIAYSPCVSHGFDLNRGIEHQKLLVQTGMWPLYRFDPRRWERGEPALHLDSPAPTADVDVLMSQETRFLALRNTHPERAEELLQAARRDARVRAAVYEQLAQLTVPVEKPAPAAEPTQEMPKPPLA